MKITNKQALFFFLFLFLLSGAGYTYALETDYSALPFPKGLTPGETLTDYVHYIFYLFFWFAIALTAVIFIVGAIRYIAAYLPIFGGGAKIIVSARKQMTSAFFGLLILISSVLLLKSINPQIIILKTPEIIPGPIVEITPQPEIPSTKHKSLIYVELPFGSIIEHRIFETQSPPNPQDKPRLERINNIASNFFDIVQKLEQNNISLGAAANQCSCSYLTAPSCVCDTCDDKTGNPPRNLIQTAELENLKLIGVSNNNQQSIQPYPINLLKEQEKTIKEIRLLKEEITKLETVEKFMLQPGNLELLNSLAEQLVNEKFYKANNLFLITTKFWEEIPINLFEDYATFYFPISGTILEELMEIAGEILISESEAPGDLSESKLFGSYENMSCEEVPIGKFIDKSKRLAYKLVERMEKLVNLSRKLTSETDQLHILISQCSSINCTASTSDNNSSSGSGYSSGYPNGNGTEPKCVGDACPYGAINNQIQKITNIIEEIKIVTTGPIPHELKYQLNQEEREEIGIIPIIKEVVSQLLIDFRKIVINGMRKCVTDVPSEGPVNILLSCQSSIGFTEKGKKIQKCYGKNEEKTGAEFQECLSQCYLEDYTKDEDRPYKNCLQGCLNKKTKIGIEEVKTWYHSLDFFCCSK